MNVSDLKSPRVALRVGYGLVPIVAGADKFTQMLTDWDQYLAPIARRKLPIRTRTFMRLVGLIEIGVGVAILTRFPKRGAYVASAWLCGIAANLIASGEYFDIAARDALLAVGAYALARLSAEEQIGITRGVPSGLPAQPGREYVHETWSYGTQPPVERR